ncbi:MAG TPA: DUF5700 domain-containing putative Zn-dependent protease [Fimbriimonadaceae bacterium]|nr:DUF5700 domain-containing putative Zn-dependent protease [Fimbriimonadaceae bacterium]
MLVATLALFAGARSTAHVTWVEDEPRAVLAILTKQNPTDADWQRLWRTEGYRRLKAREAGMHRAFTDDDFRKFVESPELKAQAAELARTLTAWSRTDFKAVGQQDMAYLPVNAKLTAKVYPLIKPRHNSFVWDTAKNPAIMLYLDPTESQERFRRTVVHELHHIGYSSCCPAPEFSAWVKKLPEALQAAWMWIGAFGEGYAVLAAAGSVEADPMAPFEPEVQAAWKHGMEQVQEDMDTIAKFLTDTVEGTLKGEAVQAKAAEFYGTQGPWYTLGWIQATTIEKAFGRKRLMECYLDPGKLMPTYNAALVKTHAPYPSWPPALLKTLGTG